MADIEITDEASLEAWLKTRPRRDAEIIAFRADLRAFPFWIRQEGESDSIETKPSTLPLLQLILAKFFSQKSTSKLYLVNNYPKLSTSSPAFAPFMAMSASAAENAASAAAYAAETAIDSNDGSAKAVQGVMAAVNRAQFFSQIASEIERSSWQAISADAIALYTGADHSHLPLWPTTAPDWFTTADRETRAIWAKDPATWAFWEKWWDGVISGDMPFPPDLLRDVALIEDDIWQAGPKAVAELINLLIQRHALQREAAAIQARLMEFIAFNEGLGANLHNQPPEDELSPVKLRATLGEISQALKEIEVALDGPEILPEVVAGLGQRLKDLWDGLSAKVKLAIFGLTFVATGISQGFLGEAGVDLYQLAKRNIDIPSFYRRLQDFGKELEKTPSPAPVFPPRPPVDL